MFDFEDKGLVPNENGLKERKLYVSCCLDKTGVWQALSWCDCGRRLTHTRFDAGQSIDGIPSVGGVLLPEVRGGLTALQDR